jgi:hypothetical protein
MTAIQFQFFGADGHIGSFCLHSFRRCVEKNLLLFGRLLPLRVDTFSMAVVVVAGRLAPEWNNNGKITAFCFASRQVSEGNSNYCARRNELAA